MDVCDVVVQWFLVLGWGNVERSQERDHMRMRMARDAKRLDGRECWVVVVVVVDGMWWWGFIGEMIRKRRDAFLSFLLPYLSIHQPVRSSYYVHPTHYHHH